MWDIFRGGWYSQKTNHIVQQYQAFTLREKRKNSKHLHILRYKILNKPSKLPLISLLQSLISLIKPLTFPLQLLPSCFQPLPIFPWSVVTLEAAPLFYLRCFVSFVHFFIFSSTSLLMSINLGINMRMWWIQGVCRLGLPSLKAFELSLCNCSILHDVKLFMYSHPEFLNLHFGLSCSFTNNDNLWNCWDLPHTQ